MTKKQAGRKPTTLAEWRQRIKNLQNMNEETIARRIAASRAVCLKIDFDENDALLLAADGLSVRKIAEALNVHPRRIYARIKTDKAFAEQWYHARHDGVLLLGDDLLDVAREDEDVQRAKLQSENIRWLISRYNPELFGERMDVRVHHIDLAGALIDARNRKKRAQLEQLNVEDVPFTIEQKQEVDVFS